jgi:capsular polysaccharide biosynthesis protein
VELRSILSLLKQKFVLIIIVVLLFMALSAVITSLYIVPKYEAKATLIVNKPNTEATTASDYTYSDLLLTQKLVNTYSAIITSDSVLIQVINNLDLNITTSELRNNLNVSGINDTEIIKITVIDSIPQKAVDIANEITRVSPNEIIRTVKAGSVELIDYAVLPRGPISPSITNNILIAGLLGLVLISLIIIAKEYLNRTIKSSAEIENLFGLPVLGELPK